MNREGPENTIHEYLTASDGTELFTIYYQAAEPRGTAVFLPGFGDHQGHYRELALFLNRAGLNVCIMDQRGNGRSSGRRGHVNDFSDYLVDLDLLFAWLEKRGDKIVLLSAQSMGGLVCLRWLEERSVRLHLVALFSPFLGLAMKPGFFKMQAARLFSGIFPGLSFKSNIQAEFLSHDPEAARIDQKDPLRHGRVTPRWFVTSKKAQDACFEKAGSVKAGSFLLLYGTEDGVASPGAMADFFEKLDLADKKSLVYAGLRHELLRETEKNKVYEDLKAWLVPRLPRL